MERKLGGVNTKSLLYTCQLCVPGLIGHGGKNN